MHECSAIYILKVEVGLAASLIAMVAKHDRGHDMLDTLIKEL